MNFFDNFKANNGFLISKYRSDYETAILNLDDLLSSMMLQTALTVDPKNPSQSIQQLANMNQAKTALNTVMKFVDKQ
jgi:CHASE3 domain sensor protein